MNKEFFIVKAPSGDYLFDTLSYSYKQACAKALLKKGYTIWDSIIDVFHVQMGDYNHISKRYTVVKLKLKIEESEEIITNNSELGFQTILLSYDKFKEKYKEYL